MVKHLPKIAREDDARKCCLCRCFGCCNDNWQKVRGFFLSFMSGFPSYGGSSDQTSLIGCMLASSYPPPPPPPLVCLYVKYVLL